METVRPILAIVRFVAVLREISENGPLSIGQMAKATSIPYSSTRRIIRTMLGHQLIEYLPQTRSYGVVTMARTMSRRLDVLGPSALRSMGSVASPEGKTLH